MLEAAQNLMAMESEVWDELSETDDKQSEHNQPESDWLIDNFFDVQDTQLRLL
jgi:hypothetical protein